MAGHLTCNATIIFDQNSWSLHIFVLSVDIVDEPSFWAFLKIEVRLLNVSPIRLESTCPITWMIARGPQIEATT